MFSFGNKFGGTRRSTTIETPQEENTASVEDAQEGARQAEQLLDAKLTELVEARGKLPELDRMIGEKIADDLDASADIAERENVHARIRQLESATEVLGERKAAADQAVQQAQREVEAEAQDAARTRVLELGSQGEALLLSVSEFVAEVHARTKALREAKGLDPYTTGKIMSQLNFWLTIAKRAPGSDAFDSKAFREYSSWSECLEKTCGR